MKAVCIISAEITEEEFKEMLADDGRPVPSGEELRQQMMEYVKFEVENSLMALDSGDWELEGRIMEED